LLTTTMSLINLIFPVNCLECQKKGVYICSSCLSKVPFCGTSARDSHSIWKYTGVVRKSILKLKYRFVSDIAKELGGLAAINLKKQRFSIKNAILIPTPLHSRRQRWRGFNQSEILGKIIAQNMNWDFEPNLLLRKKHTHPQTQLDNKLRHKNVKNAFTVNKNTKIKNNKTYIIFDDVKTTGSTLFEAKQTLKKAGVKYVYCLTIAS